MGVAYNPKIVTNGLVGYWDAANKKSYPGSGTSFFDLTGNGNTGTLISGLAFDSENKGSLVFDGIEDTINFGDVLDIGLSNWTVSAWIKSTNIHFGRVVAKNEVGADGWWMCVNDNGSFGIGLDNVWNNTAYYDYHTAGWINLVGVWNRSGFATMYANYVNLGNIVDISSKSGTNLQTNFNLRISSRDSGGGWFKGNISQVKIYNRALSEAEIKQNYNATKGRFGL